MLSGTAPGWSDPGESKIGDDGLWHEKADQVRVYSGAKFSTVDSVVAGDRVRRYGLDANISQCRAWEGA